MRSSAASPRDCCIIFDFLRYIIPRRFLFRHHRFPPQIIAHVVWLYVRFKLSLREVEELKLERGVDVSYGTIRRWSVKFGPLITHGL